MLRSDYTQAYKIDAVGELLHGDLHEFRITNNDTALITAYVTAYSKDAPFGFRWMTDNVFQEVDIETGQLLFEWRASHHFRPTDSYMTNPVGGFSKRIPFDFFHLNSIEKGTDGNYLISSRHFHAIYLIDGKTKKVIWGLGGRSKDFKDLSDGRASEFGWQHDARWLEEEKGIISLFDNSAAWPHSTAPFSQGRILQIDREKRTATLKYTLRSAQSISSSSQGSLQLLPGSPPNGTTTIFVGWGSSAVFSEFTNEGELLCETNFAAAALFWWERVKSYRAFKTLKWSATPLEWNPTAKMLGKRLYVSWNGATTVAFWELQGAHIAQTVDAETATEWSSIRVMDNKHFEESFQLGSATPSYTHYRVAALDAHRKVLRLSNATQVPARNGNAGLIIGVIVAVICIVLGLLIWTLKRHSITHKNWRHWLKTTLDRHKYRRI
jgi:hypothetical protein